jgi:alpha-beta hydrolase superfamily lysophospholipase
MHHVAARVGRGAVGVLAVLLAVSGCTAAKKRAAAPVGATARPATTTTTLVPTAGLPPFYSVPSPLPATRAGTLLKAEAVQLPGLHGAMFRVMYTSTSASGAPVAVTGLVAVPTGPAPAGGFPVVSWAHGTNGMAPQCAPSLDPGGDSGTLGIANLVLDRGWELVATDYQGEGTPGPLPYLVGAVAARNTVDIVRAARQLPAAHSSSTYAVWGHSEGGQTAMFALQLGPSYAPELHLAGVVAGAPPSQFGLIYPFLRGSAERYLLLMAVAGAHAAYGDARAPLDLLLTPLGISLLPDLTKGCDDYDMRTVDQYTLDQLFKADPATVPAWHQVIEDNDPATFTTASPVPLLIPQGSADTTIPPVTTQLLAQHLCTVGQDVTRWLYPGFGHAGVVPAYIGDMERWLAERFSGSPASERVAPTGAVGIDVTTCP